MYLSANTLVTRVLDISVFCLMTIVDNNNYDNDGIVRSV